MYLLKLIRIGDRKVWRSHYDKNFPEGSLLSEFLENFCNKEDLKKVTQMIEDPFQDGLGGNSIGINKRADGKLEIFYLCPAIDEFELIIDSAVLLQIMKMYCTLRESCPMPAEILIKFDEKLRNPTIETTC